MKTNAKSQARPFTYAQVLKGGGNPKPSYEFTPSMVAEANSQPSMVVNASQDAQPKPVSYAQVLKGGAKKKSTVPNFCGYNCSCQKSRNQSKARH